MKVSINWLKELVDLQIPVGDLVRLLPQRTIGTKEITDGFIELDMKGYNRADLLSLRGVALEVAAITNSKVTFIDEDPNLDIKSVQNLSIAVESEQANPVYCVVKIENIKVEQSNEQWIQKLFDSGMRAVNNIADITNLVMLEYGQPLHAFDAAKVADERIIVRYAKTDETIVTLDGKKRELDTQDIVISDPQKAIGIAGVMGGQNTEVSDTTTSIMLEAAIFDPKALRRTATRLGLTSEASKRFYHGLTKKRLFQALEAAIQMYEDLGGSVTGIYIFDKKEDPVVTAPLRLSKTKNLIGVDLSEDDIENYLNNLQFKLINKEQVGEDTHWEFEIPYYRLDIEIEEDLIEEVARMYGYEKIPAKALEGMLPERRDQKLFETIYNLKKALQQEGFTEVLSYAFFSVDTIDNLNFSRDDLVKLTNPISAQSEYMRSDIWPNLVKITAENLKYFKQVALFEIGKVFIAQEGNKPQESYRLSMALSYDSDTDLAQIYQSVKRAIENVGLSFETTNHDPKGYPKDLFHPTRHTFFTKNGETIGGASQIHPRVSDKFGTNKRITILEIDLTSLLNN